MAEWITIEHPLPDKRTGPRQYTFEESTNNKIPQPRKVGQPQSWSDRQQN